MGASPAGTDPAHDLGRFRLEDLIVGDATEGLWRAYDKLLKRTVAVRLMPATDSRQETLRAAACVAARVVDHRVARVLDVLDHDSTLVIVTEWVDGIPLEQLLRAPLSPARSLEITHGVVEAIWEIHNSGTAHGRLRPASVMITDDGDIRLRGHGIDAALFGIAPGSDAARADVHGIGALMMACLTARWPGSPQTALRDAPVLGGRMATPAQLAAELPDDLNTYVIRTLAAVPSATTVPSSSALTNIDDARMALSMVSSDTSFIPIVHAPAKKPKGGLQPVKAPDQPRKKRKFALRSLSVAAAIAAVTVVAIVGSNLILGNDDGDTQMAVAPLPTPSVAPVASPQPRLLEVTPTAEPAVERSLPISSAASFDPAGRGIIDGKYANFAIDGDQATAWFTSTTSAAEFSKGEGEGLILDLGSVQQFRAIDLGLVGSDTDLQIRAADERGAELSDYKKIAAIRGAPGRVTVREPTPVSARYILVYLTGVPSADSDYRGGISFVDVRGD